MRKAVITKQTWGAGSNPACPANLCEGRLIGEDTALSRRQSGFEARPSRHINWAVAQRPEHTSCSIESSLAGIAEGNGSIVAQLDRAHPYGGWSSGFKSLLSNQGREDGDASRPLVGTSYGCGREQRGE